MSIEKDRREKNKRRERENGREEIDKITSIEDGNYTETEVVRQSLLTDGFARRLRSWTAASSVAVSLRHAKVVG